MIVTALTRNRALFVIASSSTLGQGAKAGEAPRTLAALYWWCATCSRAASASPATASGSPRNWSTPPTARRSGPRWFDDTLADVFALAGIGSRTAWPGAIGPAIAAVGLLYTGAGRLTESLGALRPPSARDAAAQVFRKADGCALELLERAIALDPALRDRFRGRGHLPPQHRRLQVVRRCEAHATPAMRLPSGLSTPTASTTPACSPRRRPRFLYENLENAVELARRATTLNWGAASVWFMSDAVRSPGRARQRGR